MAKKKAAVPNRQVDTAKVGAAIASIAAQRRGSNAPKKVIAAGDKGSFNYVSPAQRAQQAAKKKDGGGGLLQDVMGFAPVRSALELADVPASYIRSHIADVAKSVMDRDPNKIVESVGNVLNPIQVAKGATGGALDALGATGVGKDLVEGTHANKGLNADQLKHTGSGEYYTRALKSADLMSSPLGNIWARRAVGFGSDVATDPLSYLGGAGEIAKGTEAAASAALHAPEKAALEAERAASTVGKTAEQASHINDIAAELRKKAVDAAKAGAAEKAQQLRDAAVRAEKLAKNRVSTKTVEQRGLTAQAHQAARTEGERLATKILKGKGASALSPDEMQQVFGDRGGLKFRVPGTGRVLNPGGKATEVTILPKEFTDKITSVLRGIKQGTSETKAAQIVADKLGGGETSQLLRDAVRSGDTEAIGRALRVKEIARTANARREAGLRLLGDATINGEAVTPNTDIGARAMDVYTKTIRPLLKNQDHEAVIRAIETGDFAGVEGAQQIKDFLNELHRAAVANGVPLAQRENYFPRWLTAEAKAARGGGAASDVLAGGKFTGEGARANEAIAEAVKAAGGPEIGVQEEAKIRAAVEQWASEHLPNLPKGYYEKNINKILPHYVEALTERVKTQEIVNRLQEQGIAVPAWIEKGGTVSRSVAEKVSRLLKQANNFGRRADTAEAASAQAKAQMEAMQALAEDAKSRGSSQAADVSAQQYLDLGGPGGAQTVSGGAVDWTDPAQVEAALKNHEAAQNAAEVAAENQRLKDLAEQERLGLSVNPEADLRSAQAEGAIPQTQAQRSVEEIGQNLEQLRQQSGGVSAFDSMSPEEMDALRQNFADSIEADLSKGGRRGYKGGNRPATERLRLAPENFDNRMAELDAALEKVGLPSRESARAAEQRAAQLRDMRLTAAESADALRPLKPGLGPNESVLKDVSPLGNDLVNPMDAQAAAAAEGYLVHPQAAENQAALLAEHAGEPTRTLYRGEKTTAQEWGGAWSNTPEGAASHAGSTGKIYKVEVPESVIQEGEATARANGHFGGEGGAVYLDPQWREAAVPAPEVANAKVHEITSPEGGGSLQDMVDQLFGGQQAAATNPNVVRPGQAGWNTPEVQAQLDAGRQKVASAVEQAQVPPEQLPGGPDYSREAAHDAQYNLDSQAGIEDPVIHTKLEAAAAKDNLQMRRVALEEQIKAGNLTDAEAVRAFAELANDAKKAVERTQEGIAPLRHASAQTGQHVLDPATPVAAEAAYDNVGASLYRSQRTVEAQAAADTATGAYAADAEAGIASNDRVNGILDKIDQGGQAPIPPPDPGQMAQDTFAADATAGIEDPNNPVNQALDRIDQGNVPPGGPGGPQSGIPGGDGPQHPGEVAAAYTSLGADLKGFETGYADALRKREQLAARGWDTTYVEDRIKIYEAAQQEADAYARRALQFQADAKDALDQMDQLLTRRAKFINSANDYNSPGFEYTLRNEIDKTMSRLRVDPSLAAPNEIADILNTMSKINAPDGVKAFLKHYDRALNYIKAWQLATPGFHVRNFMGGMFNNYLADIAPGSYRRWLADKHAYEAGTLTGDRLAMMEQALPHVGSAQYSAFEVGGMEEATRLQKLNPFSKQFGWLTANRKVGAKVEETLRGALVYDRLLKGQSIDQAVGDMMRYHFDYQDLSKFERGTVKRIIPFYTWTRHNLPLQMEMYLQAPGKYARYWQAKQEIQLGVTPDKLVPQYFLNEGFGIQTPFNFGGGTAYITPDLPFTTTVQQGLPDFSNGFHPTNASWYGDVLGNYASQVTPLLKTPIERSINRQFFKNIPFQDKKYDAPTLWKDVPGLWQGLKIAGLIDKKDKISDRDQYTVEQYLPLLGRLRRLGGGAEKDNARQVTSWLSFLGMPIRTNTKYEQQLEQYRRKYANKTQSTNPYKQLRAERKARYGG